MNTYRGQEISLRGEREREVGPPLLGRTRQAEAGHPHPRLPGAQSQPVSHSSKGAGGGGEPHPSLMAPPKERAPFVPILAYMRQPLQSDWQFAVTVGWPPVDFAELLGRLGSRREGVVAAGLPPAIGWTLSFSSSHVAWGRGGCQWGSAPAWPVSLALWGPVL